MKISSTYTIALQLLIICKHYNTEKITSNFIAKQTGADAGLIRRIMVDLKNNGIIDSKPGPGGIKLNKDLDEITLYDLYSAVTDEDESVLKFSNTSKSISSFDDKIKNTANKCFSGYISSFFKELKNHTVGDIYRKTLE